MLLITLGDPKSINVQLVTEAMPKRAVLIGSYWHWREQCAALGKTQVLQKVATLAEGVASGGVAFLDIGGTERVAAELTPKQRGEIAAAALRAVPRQSGTVGLTPLKVITMPIDKHAAWEAGFKYPGQTEFFEELWSSPATMVLSGPVLKVGLATNHLPLNKVAAALTIDVIKHKLVQLCEFVAKQTPAKKRIGVLGLNPHAGEQGALGDEEIKIIAPAIAAARPNPFGVEIVGPLPADTAFYRAMQGEFGAVLAMYHDQGLGPLKTVHFDSAINVSIGLPHVRVSPDHGPAADLYLAKKPVSCASYRACLTFVGETP
jgi:4-hydroxythreonine-4-phosphate dehydrogenase